ncbi:MAG: polyketide cyclase, partial [Planctomycetota bacterium]
MLKKIAIVVLVLAILFLVVGYLLPREYSISRSNFIAASADKIYASVVDL